MAASGQSSFMILKTDQLTFVAVALVPKTVSHGLRKQSLSFHLEISMLILWPLMCSGKWQLALGELFVGIS